MITDDLRLSSDQIWPFFLFCTCSVIKIFSSENFFSYFIPLIIAARLIITSHFWISVSLLFIVRYFFSFLLYALYSGVSFLTNPTDLLLRFACFVIYSIWEKKIFLNCLTTILRYLKTWIVHTLLPSSQSSLGSTDWNHLSFTMQLSSSP